VRCSYGCFGTCNCFSFRMDPTKKKYFVQGGLYVVLLIVFSLEICLVRVVKDQSETCTQLSCRNCTTEPVKCEAKNCPVCRYQRPVKCAPQLPCPDCQQPVCTTPTPVKCDCPVCTTPESVQCATNPPCPICTTAEPVKCETSPSCPGADMTLDRLPLNILFSNFDTHSNITPTSCPTIIDGYVDATDAYCAYNVSVLAKVVVFHNGK